MAPPDRGALSSPEVSVCRPVRATNRGLAARHLPAVTHPDPAPLHLAPVDRLPAYRHSVRDGLHPAVRHLAAPDWDGPRQGGRHRGGQATADPQAVEGVVGVMGGGAAVAAVPHPVVARVHTVAAAGAAAAAGDASNSFRVGTKAVRCSTVPSSRRC